MGEGQLRPVTASLVQARSVKLAAMEPIFLTSLASRKSAWLAARQTTVANNIANINTPGFAQKDLAPFAEVMAQTRLEMAATDASHLPITGAADSVAATREEDGGFELTESGNSVGLEAQMGKAGEISRDYALTTGIVKSFHEMLMASLKG